MCHGDPAIEKVLPGAEGARLYVPQSTLAGSVHSALSCTSCHVPLSSQLADHGSMELAAAEKACGRCHPGEATNLAKSVHAPGSAKAGSRSLPTCVTCHGAHAVLEVRSSEFRLASDRTCSKCHSERGTDFFERNYHGQEAALGRPNVATCADCHGSHLVLAPSDRRSTVNQANLPATCDKCHAAASPTFATIQIHVGGDPLPSRLLLRLVALVMTFILIGTFSFFGAHTAVSILHGWRESRKQRRQ